MNKLISRNPILRFKLGRKIVKAQFGWHVREDGVVVNSAGVPIRKLGSGYRPYSMTQDASYLAAWPDDKQIAPGLYLMPGNNNVYASRPEEDDGSAVGGLISAGPEPPANGTYYETTDASGKIVDRGRYFGGKQHSLPIGGTKKNGQQKRAYYLKGTDGSLYLIGTDGSKTLIKKGSSNTLVLKPKNSQNKISFKDAFNKARQSGLLEFVWNGGRYNTKDKGEENFVFQNGKWVAPQPAVETPVVPQIQLPTAPTSVYNLINPVEKDLKAPLSAPVVPQTYNRAQVREFLRNKGVNPYSFTGDQRKAVRMVLNGQGTDEDKALVQSMGIFNNKPKVIPLTISELDLNTQKKVMDLTKNMVTDRKWWDASLSPTVDILNLLSQLKLASLSYKQGGQLPPRNIIERFKKGRKVLTNKRVNDLGNKVIETTVTNNSNNPFKTPEEIIQEVTYNKYPEGNDTVYTYIPSHYFFTNPEILLSNNWPTAGVSLRRPEFEKLRKIFKKNFRLVAQ